MAKFGIKKIVLALAGLGLTGTALASITPDSAFSNPTPTGYGWHVTAMGDWLQPSSSNLEFASVNSSSVSLQNNSAAFGSYGEAVEPDYDFGYGFEIGMQIPGTTDDITVNWQQLNTDDTDHVTAPSANSDVVLPDLVPEQNASSKARLDYDAVNLEFGHTIFDNNWTVRPFAGLQYARIKGDLDTIGTSSESSETILGETNVADVDAVDQDGDFHGIGPRVGVDGKYNLGYGFGIVGEAAAELLVGTVDGTTNTTNVLTISSEDNHGGPGYTHGSGSDSDSVSFTGNESISPDEEHVVVPGMEAKAGLSYDQAINPSLCLGVEAGYYVADYLHALDRTNAPDLSSSVSPSRVGTVSPSNSTFFANNENPNYFMQGPYVAVSLNF